MGKIFLISDTHFNHANIIPYANRPFRNVDSMDKAIVENWNSVVSNDDIVLFLGDFLLGDKDSVITFGNKLNGHKTIVLGNHDRSTKELWAAAGFEEVVRSKTIEYYGKRILLTHRPYIGTIIPNICGHTHDKSVDDELHFNVSVERINYTPIELQEILKRTNW